MSKRFPTWSVGSMVKDALEKGICLQMVTKTDTCKKKKLEENSNGHKTGY